MSAAASSTPTLFLQQSDSQEVYASGGRWIEVVSHLLPKYGGLSAAVPQLSEQLMRDGGLNLNLAGFCAPGEEFQPQGFAPQQLSYWPVDRRSWVKDQVLQRRFEDLVRGAAGIHIHGLWEQSTALAARTARTMRTPYLISAHGMLEPWALAQKRIKKLIYAALVERRNIQGADCLHALTQAEAQQYVRFGAKSPIVIIPNGVSVPKVKDAALFLECFPQAKSRRLVLFMARLHPKKGIDMLLEAWDAVVKHHPDALLVVAGPDVEGMRSRLEQFCAEHSIAERVLFTGMLEGAMKWSVLAASECFILPSYSEGLSVGVLEAMGMGLPVVITEPCNMPEVEENGTGWEIKVNKTAVQEALEEVLTNTPSQNTIIGQRAAELISSQYSWNTIARQMHDLYRWLEGGSMPTTLNVVRP